MANNHKLKMQEAISTYIKFIPFSNFNLWDVKRYYNKENHNFENVVTLADILIPYRKPVTKAEMIKNKWQIISKINFGGELFLRDFEEINTYKGNVNLVPDNAIIYSKINVRHGCIYYHEKGKTPFGVSSEYPTYTFDESKISGKFLHKILRSDAFKKLLNTKTSGISKARVKQDEFLDIEIPLPSIDEQEKLIDAYNSKVAEASVLQNKVFELESEIQRYFLEQLGIEKSEKKEIKTGIQIFEFANIDRWDVWVNKNSGSDGTFKPVPFKSIVIGKPVYGANVKGVKHKSDTRYIRITDINENGSLNDEFVSPQFVEEKHLLKENDFLIARSGNTVGKTFLFKEKYGRAIYAGYLVKYNIDYTKVIPEYLFEYTKSYTFKNWVNSNQRIAGQPNINGQEYLEAPFIIPPMPIQKEIVKKITEQKRTIQAIMKEIELIKIKAQTAFEKEIFS